MGEFYNPDKLYKGGSRNNSLINKKMIFRVLGVLLFIESAMFLLCAAVSLCYGEQDYQYFLYTILLNTLVGGESADTTRWVLYCNFYLVFVYVVWNVAFLF